MSSNFNKTFHKRINAIIKQFIYCKSFCSIFKGNYTFFAIQMFDLGRKPFVLIENRKQFFLALPSKFGSIPVFGSRSLLFRRFFKILQDNRFFLLIIKNFMLSNENVVTKNVLRIQCCSINSRSENVQTDFWSLLAKY